MGRCWCTYFHPAFPEKRQSAEGNRDLKHRLVEDGMAHAALVFDGDAAVGWCEYGTPEQLPNIYHRAQYEKEQDLVPDYRLPCFFIDRGHRRQGVAAAALRGALDLIARASGGVVQGYPRDTQGKKMSASFLYNGTRQPVREGGVRVRAQQGQVQLRHAHDGRARLTGRGSTCSRSGRTGSRRASAEPNDKGAG
jgi:GNAT superfamily N-acetyltransferase